MCGDGFGVISEGDNCAILDVVIACDFRTFTWFAVPLTDLQLVRLKLLATLGFVVVDTTRRIRSLTEPMILPTLRTPHLTVGSNEPAISFPQRIDFS